MHLLVEDNVEILFAVRFKTPTLRVDDIPTDCDDLMHSRLEPAPFPLARKVAAFGACTNKNNMSEKPVRFQKVALVGCYCVA